MKGMVEEKMYDFKDSISLEIMKENINNKNDEFQKIAYPFLYDIYFRVLGCAALNGYIDEAISIQKEYYNNEIMLSVSNYEKDKLTFKKDVMKELRLDFDIALKDKKDQYAVVNCILNEYKRYLDMEIRKYKKEDILSLTYILSSVFSYISTTSVYLFKYNVEDVSKSEKHLSLENLIIDTIGILYDKGNIWILNLIGSLKKSSEYIIAYILHSEVKSESMNIGEVDLTRIYMIVECISETILIKKSIESLDKMGFNIKISSGTIQIDEQIIDNFVAYNNNITDNTLDVDSINAKNIIKEFEDIEGYSSKIIEDYVLKLNDKLLITEASMNLIEDKLLYTDLLLSTDYDYDSIYKVIEILSLKKCEDVDSSIFSIDNRVFRTPIIKVDNHYILSHQLLTEAVAYLRYRVLKAELTKNGQFKQKVEKNYDEIELKVLEKLVLDNHLVGGIDFKIDRISTIRPYLNSKGISKQIDFYFIYKNVLYTMEYKNQGIDNNLYEVCKTYSHNIKYKSKHLRLIEVLKNNISSLENYLGSPIVGIRSFLVFKKKTSFSEFYQGNDIYICSYSSFLEFCTKLFNYEDFEKVCEEFPFLG